MTTLVVESVLRSLVMAAIVWCGLKLLRVRHVLAQKIAWALVLVAACAMPLLMRWQAVHPGTALVAPVKRVAAVDALERRVSTLRRSSLAAAAMPAQRRHVEASIETLVPPLVNAAALSLTADAVVPARRWHARDVLRYIVPAYFFICGALLLRLAVGLAMAMRIWQRAEIASPILEPRATVRISEDIQSPVTIGSGIVLPASYTEWDRAKLKLVLAHERAHVRQGDFYLQLLASCYAALVWFSPLGWWLKRRLADLGEALSDRAALLEAEDKAAYAEVLLEFAALPRHGFAGVTAGVGMARSSNIQGRIERILNDGIFRNAFLGGRRHALIAAILVPCGLVLSTTLLHVQAAERVKAHAMAVLQTDLHPATQKPVAGTAKRADERSADGDASGAAADALRPAMVESEAGLREMKANLAEHRAELLEKLADSQESSQQRRNLEMQLDQANRALADVQTGMRADAAVQTLEARAGLDALQAARASGSSVGEGSSEATSDGDSQAQSDVQVDSDVVEDTDGNSFAIVDSSKGSSHEHNVFMGSPGDHQELDRVRGKVKGSFLWFERDGKSYVITDPAIIAKGEALYAPGSELGRRQAELGRKQAELGREQGLLAAQQAMVKVQVPDISKEMAELERSVQALAQEKAQEVTQESLGDLQAKLGEMQGKLAAAQALAGLKQSAIGTQQSDLGLRQSELGREQGELGREQERIAREAGRQVKSMIDQAMREGKAKPVD
jgi:hypothetical protein